MTELVTLPEANHLMLAILVISPIVGLIWGAVVKQLVRGLIYGVGVGVGNFALWTVYNAITDRLGLDTVKNLIVNLVLFIVLGIVAGIVIGRYNARSAPDQSSETAD